MGAAPTDFIRVTHREPHLERTKKMLATHPEVRQLFGNTPITAFFVFAIVGLQLGVAYFLRNQPIWAVLLAAYTIGALANHALWTLIHECTHNLAFKSARANSWLQIVANVPIVFPSAISFRKYHLLHHNHQGSETLDADLASPLEAKLVGNSALGKALWLLFFFLAQMLRIPRLKRIKFVDRWYVANFAFQIVAMGAVVWAWGWLPLLYMVLASIFAIGLHPVGARWIQEHYITYPDQETFSYYGPMNTLAFNVGYHNEHHDLMRVPWTRLPEVKRMAPEFYESLKFHTSWTKLLFRFIFDPSLSLYSRVTRLEASDEQQAPAPTPVDPSIALTPN